MNISRPGRLAVSTLSLTLIAAPALSQDGTGLRGTLSFDQRFDYSDNPDLLVFPDDGKITATTGLRFNLSSETRTETFNFNIGAEGIGAFGDGATDADDFDFRNESTGVSYSRDGSNSRLSLSASYSNRDIEDDVFGFFVDGEFDPDALIIDGGQRRLTQYRLGFQNGLEGPFGIELNARARDVEFVGTTDPELVNSENRSVDAVARLQLNRALTARVLTGFSDRDVSDALQTERSNSYVGFGLEGETAGGFTFTGDLTIDQSKTSELGTVVTDRDGVGISLSAAQEQNNSTLGVTLTSRIDDSGRRTSANVSRSFELPNGALSLSLGLSGQEDSTTELTTRLNYSRDFRDGRFSANVVQRPTTEDGAAFLNTSIQLNYLKDINAISSWDAGFTYGAASQFGAGSGDTQTSATISYNRELTEDWSLRAGVSTTRLESASGVDRSRDTVFLSVGRDFTFGF